MKFKLLGATFVVAVAALSGLSGAHASPSSVVSLNGFHSTTGVAFSKDGSRAFVVQNDFGVPGGLASIVVVDTTTLSQIGDTLSTGIPGAGVNHAIVMSPDGTKAYVSVGDGTVLPFSPSTLTFGSAIIVGTAGVGQIAFTPDGTKAYVAVTDNGNGSNVTVIDVATDSVVDTITTCAGPDGLAITPDGQKVFVNCSDGSVAVIETAGNTVVTSFTPTGHLQGTTIVMSPDGSEVYATAFAIPTTVMSVINTTTYATDYQFTNEPKDAAFSRDGSLVNIFSASSGDLVPTDPVTFAAGAPIDVTGPSTGSWFLIDRNPVVDQYWITGGSFLYVVGDGPQLPQTGVDTVESAGVLTAGAILICAGILVIVLVRRTSRRLAR